jgi:predicted transcriptional regulator
MKTQTLNVGIMSKADYQKRTIAIAKGEYKPKPNEPKIWFESIKSLAQVLSYQNQQLLKTIIEYKPHSLSELENLTGRKKSNLSRTLKTLERYGIVSLIKINNMLMPTVCATDFNVGFGLNGLKAC